MKEEKSSPKRSKNSDNSSGLPPGLARIDEEERAEHSASKLSRLSYSKDNRDASKEKGTTAQSNELADALNYVNLSAFVSFFQKELKMTR